MLARYRSITDGSTRPLKDSSASQRFQMLPLLALVSTAIFITGAGAWMWAGPLFAIHLFAGWLAVNRVTFAQESLVSITWSRSMLPVPRGLGRVNAPTFRIDEGAW